MTTIKERHELLSTDKSDRYFDEVHTAICDPDDKDAQELSSQRLLAKQRLLCSAASDVSYEAYCSAIEASFRGGEEINALFGLSGIGPLKSLMKDLKEIAGHLKDAGSGAIDAVIKAFKEKSVFALLKGVGFSLKKLLQAISAASKVPSNALQAFMEDVVTVFGSIPAIKKMDVKERVHKVEELLKKHKAIAHISGIALAGFLIWMYLNSGTVGNPGKDLDLIDAVIACISGNFDLVEMFTSPAALHALACLVFGLTGISLTDYGFSKVHEMFSWISNDGYNLLLALFFKGARKLGEHVNMDQVPKALKSNNLIVDRSGRRHGKNQDWFDRKAHEDKHEYAELVDTKFVDPTRLIAPD